MGLVDRMRAVSEEAAPKFEQEIIGHLLWYTVSDVRITRSDLEAAFKKCGIDDRHLPKPISPRDAFRRATSAQESKGEPLADGRRVNLLVREVVMDDAQIVRHLVREVVDARNVRLEYREMAALKLVGDGQAAAFASEWLSEDPNPEAGETEVQSALRAAETAFHVERENYNGRNMRDVVQDVLNECRPVAVRPSGGVYFVAAQHEPVVQALKALVAELDLHKVNGGRRSRLYTVPVIDAGEQRDMVAESLEDQVAMEAKTLIGDMERVGKTGRKVTPLVARQFGERVRELGQKVIEYEAMLQRDIAAAEAAVELAGAQVTELLERVEIE